MSVVVTFWLALVVALTFGTAPGRSLAVIGPQAQAIAEADGRVLASNAYVTIARSNAADFVGRLYAAPCWCSMPSRPAAATGSCPKRS